MVTLLLFYISSKSARYNSVQWVWCCGLNYQPTSRNFVAQRCKKLLCLENTLWRYAADEARIIMGKKI